MRIFSQIHLVSHGITIILTTTLIATDIESGDNHQTHEQRMTEPNIYFCLHLKVSLTPKSKKEPIHYLDKKVHQIQHAADQN